MTNKDTLTPATDDGLKTLLIVEDEILIRFHIGDYLRECGYRVIEAASADEAVIVLEAPDLTIDLVLSDVAMPGAMDGFGLAQWMRAYKPHIPIILVGSAARAANAAGDLCESGPMLMKPYDPQILLDRIKRVLAERLASENVDGNGKAEEIAVGLPNGVALLDADDLASKPAPLENGQIPRAGESSFS